MIIQPVNDSYRYLDGYIPPLPQADNNEDSSTDSSNSSISDDNEHLIQENHNVIPEEKQVNIDNTHTSLFNNIS